MNKQGIAMATGDMEDLDTLDASWGYNWQVIPSQLSDPRYVPMNYSGGDVALPDGYDGFILFLNEPDAGAPYGANISPQLAAERYKIQSEKYPDAKFVVGNTLAWDFDWPYQFRELIKDMKPPHAYGLHGYIEGHLGYNDITGWWQEHIGLLGRVWVTEFSDTHCNTGEFWRLLEWLRNNPMVERYAAFINRATGYEVWYPGGWKNVSLIDEIGEPTAMGRMMLPMKKVYMPMVSR